MNRKRTDVTRDERALLDDERSRSEEDLEPAPLSGTRAVRSKTAHGSTPSVASQVTELHARLDRLNHFELLDLSETADRQSVRRAFEQRAHRFHPDRLLGDDERLRPLAAKVFLRIAEAYRVLDNESTRKHYIASLGLHRPSPEPRAPADLGCAESAPERSNQHGSGPLGRRDPGRSHVVSLRPATARVPSPRRPIERTSRRPGT